MKHINIKTRPFQNDKDFWHIRSLAIETYPINGPGWNWDLRRWDGSRFYKPHPEEPRPEWQKTIRLWEEVGTDDATAQNRESRLVGVTNGDGEGLFYLQLRPDYRWMIEEDMIAWAEENLSAPGPEAGQRQINTEVWEYDAPRQRLLEKRGYVRTPYYGVLRLMRLGNQPIPEAWIADGYTMREVHAKDPRDCQRIADLLNAAFNRDFHNAEEFQQFARCAPCYREDLHLVAVAPDGSFAAHVAAIYDEENRRGLYEPVCTHPAHRRKSLAQSLMFAGLKRLKASGAITVTVETGDMAPANALYDTIGFGEVYKSFLWRKIY